MGTRDPLKELIAKFPAGVVVEIQGIPQACASERTVPPASRVEAKIKQSSLDNSSGISSLGICPKNFTRVDIPNFSANAFRSLISL